MNWGTDEGLDLSEAQGTQEAVLLSEIQPSDKQGHEPEAGATSPSAENDPAVLMPSPAPPSAKFDSLEFKNTLSFQNIHNK